MRSEVLSLIDDDRRIRLGLVPQEGRSITIGIIDLLQLPAGQLSAVFLKYWPNGVGLGAGQDNATAGSPGQTVLIAGRHALCQNYALKLFLIEVRGQCKAAVLKRQGALPGYG